MYAWDSQNTHFRMILACTSTRTLFGGFSSQDTPKTPRSPKTAHTHLPKRALIRLWAAQPHPVDTQISPRRKNTQYQSKPVSYGRCRDSHRARAHSHAHASERHRRRDGKRRGSRGDGGNGMYDRGGDGGDDERGDGCESRAQTSVSIRVRANGSTSRDVRM